MKIDRIRQLFKPLFGLERSEAVARLLYLILGGVVAVVLFDILIRLWNGNNWHDPALQVLSVLLLMQFVLLYTLRHNYIHQTAVMLSVFSWVIVTYLTWNSHGIHDVAIFAYVLIILTAALLANWRVSLTLTVLTVMAIWGFAIAEARGLRTGSFDDPLSIARDLTIIFSVLIMLVFLVVNALRQTLERTQTEFLERLRAEQALQAGEERFRKMFHASPVAIVITTLAEGRIIDANNAYWQLSGHDPLTSIGRTTYELRHTLESETREKFVQELLEKRSIQNLSYDFLNDSGEHLKTMAFYELIDVDDGPAILSMFYDMTEQSKARDALHQSELRLRAMLEAVPDMIFEIKRDGTIAHFIPAAVNELNYTAETIIGKNISQILPGIAQQMAFAMGRALESGQVHAFEFDLQLHGERKVFEARVTPASSDLVLAMLRDVSLSKWSESEREKLIGELEEKNAELERFTYTASHDLKSPLITIRGFLSFVREDAQAGNMVRLEKDIQRINDATEKMQRLLNDLLELSRVGRVNNKPEPIATNILVAEVVELLHGRISAGKITVQISENLPSIYGDRQRIFEVFQNLIDNASKFMGDQINPCIEIGAQGELNDKPVFFVHDNGIGISPQFKERIFGLFDKLNARSEGTGIGLALVKRIVEFHSGQIWVESEPGNGTTFFFSLPSQPVTGEATQ
jgi:PAS domain S-box-containing protein